MGADLTCRATYRRKTSDGRAVLETDYVLFRGDFRVKLPLQSITGVKVSRGVLSLTAAEGALSLALGAHAERWAEKIRSPRTRAQKLGLKAGQRVSVVGVDDAALVTEIEGAGATVSIGRAAKGSDVILFAVNAPADLRRFTTLQPSLAAGGALWSIRPKGHAVVSEARVREAGLAAGLVDVKVVRYSDTHTAEKFVVRRTNRSDRDQ